MKLVARCICVGLIFLASAQAIAEKKRPVPYEFEGIKLGATYPAGSPERWGIDAMAFAPGTLGVGLQIWFKPRKENPELEFRVLPIREGDSVPRTSHRLFLVGTPPPGVETHSDPSSLNFESFTVHAIEWSDDRGEKKDHYWWAVSLCRALGESLAAKPKVIDNMASNYYSCEFSEGGRQFEVSSFVSRSVRLSYSREITDAAIEKIDKTLRRVRAGRILQN